MWVPHTVAAGKSFDTRCMAMNVIQAAGRVTTHLSSAVTRLVFMRTARSSSTTAALPTCDLLDKYHTWNVDDMSAPGNERVRVMQAPGMRDYGGNTSFSGRAATIQCFENNPLVREAVTGEDGNGRVLVVDGGGSMRCALLGDMLAASAADRNWAGVIVNGCVRDSAALRKIGIGVKALGTHPLKSSKRDRGRRGCDVTIGGALVREGDYIYADEDGIVVSDSELHLDEAE